MIGNPRGYGKSALVKEMAFKRDEICKKMKIPSGPVLFTDFRGVKNSSDAKKRILETIQPLFFEFFSFLRYNYKGGIVFLLFFISLTSGYNSN